MPSDVQYTIAADASRFLGGFQAANTALGQGVGFIQRHAAALASLAGVSISVAGMLNGFKAALDMGGTLSDLSARTGQSVKDLVILRQAFENAGVGADSVGPTINLMQKALAGISEEGEPTNKIFERLGLNMAELKSSSAVDALQTISDKISALPTAAERAEAAMKIFGRTGGSMLALLGDKGALGDAATMVGGQAEILARNAAIFDRASDILNASGVKLKGFFVGLADKLTPQLAPLLEMFNKMDFSSWGQRIGDAINTGIAAFKSGELVALLSAAFDLVGMRLVNTISNAIQMGAEFSVPVLAGLLSAAVKVGFSGNFWEGLAFGIEGFVAKFLAAMVPVTDFLFDSFVKAAGAAAALMELAASKWKGTEFKGESWSTMDKVLANSRASSADAKTRFQALGGEDVRESGKNLAAALRAAIPEIMSGIREGMANAEASIGSADIYGALDLSVAQASLEEIFNRFAGSGSTTGEGKKPGETAGAGEGAGGKTAPKIEADRLMKIGGFIGGSSPAGLDYSRRTADSTTKSADAARDMIEQLESMVDLLGDLLDKDWTVEVEDGLT
ncbi:MAG: hypothetical protein HZA88_00600 [Verrucomicrobia bacterium]|nr:hypothetical protein [Verrucomicrobiota bacterium]